MWNPELLTAYGVAGLVVTLMMLTAFKIVRASGGEPVQPNRRGRDARAFWPPLAPGRR